MGFYEKVDLAKPTQVIQDQIMLEVLDEANESFKQVGFDQIIRYCFTISGEPIKSILDIHNQCRVLVVSD